MEIQELNEFIKSQEVHSKEISQIFTNIKKDSPSRKTVTYIAEKRARLTELYTITSSNHDRLKNQELLKNHRYITSDYFGTIKNLYVEAMAYLDKCESKLQVQHELYEPLAAEPRQKSVASSAKINLQMYRIQHIRQNLQKVTQSLNESKPMSHFTMLLETLQKQWQKVEETHFDLFEEESAISHRYFEDSVFDTLKNEYDYVNDQLCDKIQSADTKQQQHSSTVKMPKINIPTFNGSFDSWNLFYDLFLTIIHNNDSLSNTEKMQYLKTHLRGDAIKLIKHLTVCDANYVSAWTLLVKRYKNERQIVIKHIDNILNIPQIKKGDAVNLRNLYDTVNENLEALKNQNIQISSWDTILTRIISRIWDSETDEKYELQLEEPTKLQSFVDMMGFLEKRVKCLESNNYFRKEINKPRHETTVVSKNTTCGLCHQQHTIYNCTQFLAMSTQQRNIEIANKRLCKKCLMHDSLTQCYTLQVCKHCGRKGHHTLLHNEAHKVQKKSNCKEPESNNSGVKPSKSTVAKIMSSNTAVSTNAQSTTLLATALVQTRANDGTPQILRVLCDQGSEASFCTEEVAQLLCYPRSKIQTEITGIADENPKKSNYCIDVELKPRFPSNYKLPVTLIIMPKLTGCLPKRNIPQIRSDYIENILLADPTYYKQGPIDVILGAQEYSRLLIGGLRKMQDGMIAQETELGWILSGICSDSTMTKQHTKIVSMTTRTTEIQQLTKFWELEDVPETYKLSNDDQLCEKHYNSTTVRNPDGTYTVRLPFKNPNQDYGNTRKLAVARLIQLERKFAKDTNLQSQYQTFLREYLDMGHMRKVSREDYGQGRYYIPHQPVIKEESLTTKLRVVFDASCKTSACKSLNSNLFAGPRLQQDLSSILLRWRKHQIVFMADIEKMYRFIKIDERDMTYQRILWRESPKSAIDEYELTTVTYGTTSAPYLAIKTLQQLAIDERMEFPEASKVALNDYYVDDVLSGESTIEKAKMLQTDLIRMLQAGGFNLRKWSSNNAQLLENIPNDNKLLKIPLDETRKSLGILWSPLEDKFSFSIDVNRTQRVTKRVILSEISKIFDPLGWLAPVIINMKLMIQELWTNGIEWDEPVDDCSVRRWIGIQDQLKRLEDISIPRWCRYTPDSRIELHGFCDASEKAYGAVIYCRVKNHDDQYDVTLLQAKSKVAPKKHKATLPKLELCAALLLVKLLDKVIKTIEIPSLNIYCWTDSMITLGWIKGEAERWKTFVANRVSEIQQLLPQAHWSHVSTDHNPADVISRGIDPSKLKDLTLWWNGPEWLKSNILPSTKSIPEICEEVKRCFHVKLTPQNTIWDRFSSFKKMVRVLSYCYRFGKRIRSSAPLSVVEMCETTNKIVFLVQQEVFSVEYKAIKSGVAQKKGSRLSCLDPFIDTNGLLRVGGRLHNSNLPYDQKHPILLPRDHNVTLGLVHDAHLHTLHGGNNLTLSYIRQKFWIIGGKHIVKSYIKKCVKCIRYRASANIQKMGVLPKARVTESFPFSHTGIDYAGPVQVRTTKGRGHKSYKGYIAVFVCLATKAIHLELVGDLSTESFIAALRRFMARRGPVSHMYSDNATNFVGAANFLYKELLEITQSSHFQNTMNNIGIQWHFIPPSSPHFGGIWEAGVKSMKHHLRRVIGEQTLTYEELSTFLHQTEACLNSRPLCAQSDNINDAVVLTPSHFLIGREAVGIPDPLVDTNTDLLNRWKQIQRMKRDFWKSWTSDYLQQLQQRYKWKTNQENLTIGTLVLIKDDNISPSKWPLAKVKEVHTGSDGLVRVVTLRKPSGTTQKRSIHTLIPLPLNATMDNNSNDTETNKVQVNVVTRHTNKSESRSSKANWLIYFLIILQMFSGVQAATTYSLRQLPPGVYVEQLGTATVDRGTFRIESIFDREYLQQEQVKIKSVTYKFRQLCRNADVVMTETHCDQLLYHLTEQEFNFDRIKEYLSEISLTRKKRGLLGQFLTSIFGVNDEVYKDIDSLNANQQHLIEAANHQTKFMLSTISQVNSTEERVRQKLESFQSKLNQVISSLNDYNHWYVAVDRNNVKIQIMQTYQLASAYITEITDHYNGLLEIYLAKATMYSILPPKNVSEIITTANKKLPSNLKIVQQQLLETRIQENATHIQVHAYFPIQDTSKYMLIHVTAIPKKNDNNSFQIIEIPKAYIALDYNNELYFELSEQEFKSCLQKGGRFICFPVAVKNMQFNKNCIVDQLFKNQTSSKCPAKSFHISSNIIWKQLDMLNTWLYVVKNSTVVSILCDGQRKEVVLRDIGVIKISDNCIIKSTSDILAAQRSVSVKIISSYSKQIDFSVDTYVAQNSKSNQIVKEEVLDNSRDFFQHLTNNEKSVRTELDNTIWRQISSHTYLVSFSTSIIALIIILTLVWYGPKVVRYARAQVPSKPKQQPPEAGRQPLPSRIDAVYSQPVRRPEQVRASSPLPAVVTEEIELYEMEPVPERGQNVHT